MRCITFWSRITLAVTLLFTLAIVARAADEKKEGDEPKKIKEADVPQKVRDTIKEHFPKATIDSIEKENEDGKVVFDFEMKQDGIKYEADVQDDGTLLETEKQIKESETPEAVTKAVKDKYPNASIKEVMVKMKGNETAASEYEIVVSSGGKDQEVTVSADGSKVTDEAAEEAGKDKDKDKEKDEKGKEKEEKEK